MKTEKHNSKHCAIKYKVVRDDYSGYEVRIRRWWWPFWVQKWEIGTINTHASLEIAKQWISEGCPKLKFKQEQVWTGCKCDSTSQS